mmetsp:Transcript_134954/g.288704  ORF Transcript_134954/g.288704 Transcript_134954/m.288704 type:complete len:325 (+) Transcript_134954:70-1044(+)
MVLISAASLFLVAQHRAPQPLLGALNGGLTTPLCIGLDLVHVHLPHREVLGLRVCEDEGRDRCAREHHVGLCELKLLIRKPPDVKEVPHGLLLAVIRLRRVPWRRPDALVAHLQEVIQREVLVRGIAPERSADLQVDELSEGLGEAIGDSLQQDGLVDLPGVLEDLALLMAAQTTGACEGGDVVRSLALWCDEVALAPVGRLTHVELLTQAVERLDNLVASLAGVDLDVVADGVCGMDADHARGAQDVLVDNPVQHLLGLVEELRGLLPDTRVFEDGGVVPVGVLPTELVDLEEGRPVDVLDDLLDGVVLDAEVPEELRLGRHL